MSFGLTPTGGWRISGGIPVGSAGDGFDFGPFAADGTGTAPVEVVVVVASGAVTETSA